MILLLLLGCLSAVQAQEAEIFGKVTDKNGVPLVGATVYPVGAVVGDFTDNEGHYKVDIASGDVRIIISYIGYENFDTTVVIAIADREVEINAVLTESFNDLPEAQVIARRASGQAQALRLQQSGLCTQTIIHSETFNKYPDITLAETVSRMPGVSMIRDVSRGQVVQLRGLPEQYTAVSLNGQRLPNVQPEDDQSGALDIIQSNLVDEVRIIKSRTAELDGDAIAGIVDFRIRQPEEKFEVFLQAAQGSNFGFSDNPNQHSGITQLAGALNSEVSEEKVFLLAAGSYLKEGRGVRTQLLEYEGESSTLRAARPYDENLLTERVGFVGAIEFRPSPFNRMRVSVNQSIARQEVERRQLFVPNIVGESFNRVGSAWQTDRRLSLVALEVENNFARTRLDYQLSFSDSKEALDGRRRNVYTSLSPNNTGGSDIQNLSPYADLGSELRETAQRQQDALLTETVAIGSINLTRWLNQKRTASLKVGGRYRSKDRAYGSVDIPIAISDGNIIGPTEFGELLTDRPLEDFADPAVEGLLYDAKQRIAAAYLMYSANFSAKFSLNAGLRYEYLEVEARNAQDTVSLNNNKLLPSLNLVYRVRRDRQIRLSVYEALGRPNYANYRPRGESPLALISLDRFNTSNPAIQATGSTNIDLTFERYGKRDGLISVGIYGKWIESPTVRRSTYRDASSRAVYFNQLENTPDAQVVGFEAAMYQSLGPISEKLRHFNINATANINLITIDDPGGEFDDLPIAQAPRQSANISVVYSNPKKGLNLVAAVNYRSRFFEGFLNDRPVWRNNFVSVDLSADYEVFKNISLFLRMNNLTNHPFEEWIGEPDEAGSLARSKSRYGAWGLVGVRFKPTK
jgi:outer membrane receptor protein involved in Fe transport